MGEIVRGLSATVEHTVSMEDTALSVGTGDLDVLGTPRLLTMAEAATCAAIATALDPSETSVGTRIRLDHARPSPVGAVVRVVATVSEVDGRVVRFTITAGHAQGGPDDEVAKGEITRMVVDREGFLRTL